MSSIMESSMWHLLKPNWFTLSVIGVIVYIFFNRGRLKKNKYMESAKKPTKIQVITDPYDCRTACRELKKHCSELSALGFDCEWTNKFGALGPKESPVALLQLASFKGLCYLFRLNVLTYIPIELCEILADPNIIKLGVNPFNDAKLLANDYLVQVKSTVDLRYLYPTIPGGLAGLSHDLLEITLNKHPSLPCSNWEAFELTDSQQFYAAMDAFVAIEIFKKWLNENKINPITYPSIYHNETRLCGLYDRHYTKQPKREKLQNSSYEPESALISQKKNNLLKGHQIRKKPLYHNCFMHAPDGELLCSCDKRKAEWYIEKGLAEVFLNEPYSIRLLFEPAARANESNEGRFYQQLKQNCCVVCGANNSYLRYNVVPREYRKHFPKIMKEHQSHDIVLLCTTCHQIASYHAKIFKEELAKICNAPFNSKVKCSGIHKKIKNYGKALLNSGDNIPLSKKIIMENEIKNFFNVTVLTTDILHNAACLKEKFENEGSTHGLKVTQYYSKKKGGLMELERHWRTYFLKTMKPEYLPALWSITHNHSRLISKEFE